MSTDSPGASPKKGQKRANLSQSSWYVRQEPAESSAICSIAERREPGEDAPIAVTAITPWHERLPRDRLDFLPGQLSTVR